MPVPESYSLRRSLGFTSMLRVHVRAWGLHTTRLSRITQSVPRAEMACLHHAMPCSIKRGSQIVAFVILLCICIDGATDRGGPFPVASCGGMTERASQDVGPGSLLCYHIHGTTALRSHFTGFRFPNYTLNPDPLALTFCWPGAEMEIHAGGAPVFHTWKPRTRVCSFRV